MVLQTPNPLPPPPRRRTDGGASNLSNADFRKMVMETPRRAPAVDSTPREQSRSKKEPSKRPPRKFWPPKFREEKETKVVEDSDDLHDQPKYRDRARERRDDQNPDYEVMQPAGISTLQAVAPPGAIDAQDSADLQKIAIANSKYLGGDVEHTHLVKGLDYALLNKVRSEMEKKPEDLEPEVEARPRKDDDAPSFHSAAAKVVYRWIVKPPSFSKSNDLFLPGRMAFAFDMEEMSHHIPTTVYRSKDDCPAPEEYVAAGVDAAVTERIANIMQYLKLGSSGRVLKKKKKEKIDSKAIKAPLPAVDETRATQQNDEEPENLAEEALPDAAEPPEPRNTEDDIFQDAGIDYEVTVRSPASEDMEESPTREEAQCGPLQGPTMPTESEWQGYGDPSYEYQNSPMPPAPEAPKNPQAMSQEEKDRGMGSVFKRDDQRLRQRRELDAREKDPNFVSESYSECYPGYQEYNREVVDSDDDDLTKMDMGAKAKGRLHRWDFESEEDWAKYNEQKEAMPKAAYQFGVKMQDGRKTRKQNKDQKLNSELNKITKIMEKMKREKGEGEDDGHPPGKRARV